MTSAQNRGPSSTSIRGVAPITIASDSRDLAFLKDSNPGQYKIAINVGTFQYLSSNLTSADFVPVDPELGTIASITTNAPNLDDISIDKDSLNSDLNTTYINADGAVRAKIVFKIKNPDNQKIVDVEILRSKTASESK